MFGSRKAKCLSYEGIANQEKCSEVKKQEPPEVFCRKGALKIFAKLTGKHLWLL